MSKPIKITNPQSLGIVREILARNEEAKAFQQKLQENAAVAWEEYVDRMGAEQKEDFERLRLSLSLPSIENMQLIGEFLECGVAFLKPTPKSN